MFCPLCGSHIEMEASNFCPYCGQPLDTVWQQKTVAQSTASRETSFDTFAVAADGADSVAVASSMRQSSIRVLTCLLFSAIGLTLVAGGTSLPELATSVTAALKKNPGIAIGNVIGSNLFNIFFVLGCSATVSPLPMGNINNLDLSVLIASSLLLWLVGWFFRKRTITRLEGALMVGCYVVYTAYLIAQQ